MNEMLDLSQLIGPAVVGLGLLTLVTLGLAGIRTLIYLCRPSEVLIFSGRNHQLTDGRTIGFRVVTGGRAFRLPILERVDRMDISLLSVPMAIQGAYSQGGIPLSVHAIANVKVSSDPQIIGNAIERFLGHDRMAIARVAKETLEGHLRGVLANMTPEEVNEDRLKFADRLSEEAEDDLRKLGLQLDTLKIQNVTDDRKYLDSVGRARIAEALRAAEVAESDAVRSAEESEAKAQARGHVAQAQADANIQRRRNALRQTLAELEAQARSEEERTKAAALEARAEAEKALQTLRAQVEQLRLTADVTVPAEMERQVKELEAAGHATPIAENGRAMAEALERVAAAWKASGAAAMDIFVLQHIEELLVKVTNAASSLEVGKVALLDAGDGQTLARYASAFPATVSALFDELHRTLGVDIRKSLAGATTPR